MTALLIAPLLCLLAGYLLPALPLALVALLRWPGLPRKLFALTALVLGVAALVLTYSRGAWMGLVAEGGVIVLLLAVRGTRAWPPLWRKLFPLLLLVGGAALLVVLVTQVEPLRVRVMSLVAGRQDSSNNFRINVWLAAIDMIQARPWLGIGPGNTAFNLIYPLYQQPKFNALSAYSVPLELLVEGGARSTRQIVPVEHADLRLTYQQFIAAPPVIGGKEIQTGFGVLQRVEESWQNEVKQCGFGAELPFPGGCARGQTRHALRVG